MQWITNLALLLFVGGLVGLTATESDLKDLKSDLLNNVIETTSMVNVPTTDLPVSSMNKSQVPINETSQYPPENGTKDLEDQQTNRSDTSVSDKDTLKSDAIDVPKHYVESSNDSEIQILKDNKISNTLNESVADESKLTNDTAEEVLDKNITVSEDLRKVNFTRATSKRSTDHKEIKHKMESTEQSITSLTSDASSIFTTMITAGNSNPSSISPSTSKITESQDSLALKATEITPSEVKPSTETSSLEMVTDPKPVKRCSGKIDESISTQKIEDCEEVTETDNTTNPPTEVIFVTTITIEEVENDPKVDSQEHTLAIDEISTESPVQTEDATRLLKAVKGTVIEVSTEHIKLSSSHRIHSRGERSFESKPTELPVTMAESFGNSETNLSTSPQSSTEIITSEKSLDSQITTTELPSMIEDDSLSFSETHHQTTSLPKEIEKTSSEMNVEFTSSSSSKVNVVSDRDPVFETTTHVSEMTEPPTTSPSSTTPLKIHNVDIEADETVPSDRTVVTTHLQDSTVATTQYAKPHHLFDELQMDSPHVPSHTKDIGFRQNSHIKHHLKETHAKLEVEHPTNNQSLATTSANPLNDSNLSSETKHDKKTTKPSNDSTINDEKTVQPENLKFNEEIYVNDKPISSEDETLKASDNSTIYVDLDKAKLPEDVVKAEANESATINVNGSITSSHQTSINMTDAEILIPETTLSPHMNVNSTILSTTSKSVRIRKPKLKLNGESDSSTTAVPFRRATTSRLRRPPTQKLDLPSGTIFRRNGTGLPSITSSTTPGSTTRYSFQRVSYRSIAIVGTEAIPLGMLPVSTTPSTTTTTEEEEEEEEDNEEEAVESHAEVTQKIQPSTFSDDDDITLIKIAAATVVVNGMRWKKELHTRLSPQYKKQELRMQQTLEKIFRGSPLGDNLWKLEIDGFIESYPGSRKVMVDYSVYFVKTDDPVDKLQLARVFNERLGNNSSSRYTFDPAYTQFEILREEKLNDPTEPPEIEPPIPQWAIAVIVIGAASFIFIVLFAAVTVYGRHHMRRRYATKMDDDLERSVDSREWEKKLAAAAAYENLAADVVYDVDDSGLENVKKSYYLD